MECAQLRGYGLPTMRVADASLLVLVGLRGPAAVAADAQDTPHPVQQFRPAGRSFEL